MQEEQSGVHGDSFGSTLTRLAVRCAKIALAAAIVLSTGGCTLSLSPLAKHTAAFSTATAAVVDGSKRAYLAADKLHIDEEMAAAIDSYGAPGWSPYTPLKPLLTPEQLAARIKVLDGLKAYADYLAGLTETKNRDTKLQTASTTAGSNLASLSSAGAPAIESVFPGATEAAGASTAIAGLAELLINGRAKKALAQTTAEMDPDVQTLCRLISSDAKTLQTESDRDYRGPIGNLDEFLQHHANADPVGRRAVVGKMIELARQQRLNDELLGELQKALLALAAAHKALADAAAGKDPETIKQRLQELISLGTELGTYYYSLQAAGG